MESSFIHWIPIKWSMQKIRVASLVYKKSLKGVTWRHWRSASRKRFFRLKVLSRTTNFVCGLATRGIYLDRGTETERGGLNRRRARFSRNRRTDDKCVATRKCKWLPRALVTTCRHPLLVIASARQPFKSSRNKKRDENERTPPRMH